MIITKGQLRSIIREACQYVWLENQDYIPKLVTLVTSNDFKTVLQGIDLAETIGLVEIQGYEQPKQTLKRKTPPNTFKVFNEMVLKVDETFKHALQEVKHFPARWSTNDPIVFEYDRPSVGYLTIRYVEEGIESTL